MLQKYLLCFLVSMVPLIELRGGVPIAVGMGLDYFKALAVCVEECISKGVFGTGTNVFASFRKQAKVIKNH